MSAVYENVTRIKSKYSISFLHNYTSLPKQMVDLHWHEVYEILYIRRGHGEQRINADTISLSPGDLVVIQPGDLHATKAVADDGCDIDFVQFFDTVLFDKEYVSSHIKSGVICSDGSNFKRIFDAFNSCDTNFEQDREIIMAGLAQLLVGFVLRESDSEYSPSSQAIEAVCRYLEHSDDLLLEHTAAQFGYTPEHLSRRFHKEIGVSYQNWCQRIRMQRAVKLLSDRNRTISDIAYILKYSNESSFIRAFKSVYGTSPNAWRKYMLSEFEADASRDG